MFKNSGVPGAYQKGEWWLELKTAKLRKTESWGDTFTAITGMSVANGEAHIEGLLAKDGHFNRQDVKTIEGFCSDFGFTYYITSTLVDGERVHKRVDIEQFKTDE